MVTLLQSNNKKFSECAALRSQVETLQEAAYALLNDARPPALQAEGTVREPKTKHVNALLAALATTEAALAAFRGRS